MAIKKTKESVNLIDSFKDFKETKNIDKATLVSVIEDSFRSVLQKTYGNEDSYDLIVNPEKGDFEIYHNRTVVPDGEVKNENTEISLSEAQKIDDDYEVGEEVSQRVNFSDFGRRAILTLRQTMAAKILELEHDNLYNKYKDKVGQIITAEVYQIWKRETLLLDDDGNELLMPKSTSSAKAKQHAPSCSASITSTTTPKSSSPAHRPTSCADCSRTKSPKSATDSSPSTTSYASPANAPK